MRPAAPGGAQGRAGAAPKPAWAKDAEKKPAAAPGGGMKKPITFPALHGSEEAELSIMWQAGFYCC